MKTAAALITKITKIEPKELPDGKHKGLWSGFQVVVNLKKDGKEQLIFDVERGVRKQAWPCIVTVSDGNVEIESLEQS